MNTLTDKHILLGITGSIAAYKSADLVRRLREQGAQVQVIMTAAATAFITPLTLQSISGQPVYTQLLDAVTESAMEHIELARWADMVLIAPASADFLAKLAGGHADDLLSTVCLATNAPIVVAPAMNSFMWQAPATQENCQRLQQYGIKFFGPATGSQACGEVGKGRLLEPNELVDQVQEVFQTQFLAGYHVLVTAGPTREDIDPVRFISNRSSGRMGYAIAQSAKMAGAQVTLISGPVALPPVAGVQLISVYSAQDMLTAVMTRIATVDIFIAAAAVADYRPSQLFSHKIKKYDADWQITLERTPDILATVAALPHPPFTVGFAAETDNLLEYAREKLQQKQLNMIAANWVGVAGIGFDSEKNALNVLWAEGGIELPCAAKTELAGQLLEIIIQQYQQNGYLPHQKSGSY
ncbi:MAG: bifunctional phosphopantothenoylcysteine decarboxylase/phosphopantothenate--cysteine ligase CoaBC [Thioploca sp.]|nr:bifunctional phosphopantothenoylcysteine decarboxylase/phosphopantothenate--cysteine ligase CoaBC [Thioploca sp.]